MVSTRQISSAQTLSPPPVRRGSLGSFLYLARRARDAVLACTPGTLHWTIVQCQQNYQSYTFSNITFTPSCLLTVLKWSVDLIFFTQLHTKCRVFPRGAPRAHHQLQISSSSGPGSSVLSPASAASQTSDLGLGQINSEQQTWKLPICGDINTNTADTVESVTLKEAESEREKLQEFTHSYEFRIIIHGVIFIKLFVNKKPMKSHGEKGYLSDQQWAARTGEQIETGVRITWWVESFSVMLSRASELRQFVLC